MGIPERYAYVRAQVDEVCRAAGRDPSEVKLLAVSKTVDVPAVADAIAAGATAFGENRPDQLVPKQAAYPQVEWHFIGNIQSRRIRDIVPAATLIHSVFKESHLAKIDAAAREAGKVQDILVEVNVSGEESKSGLEPLEVRGFIEAAGAFAVTLECIPSELAAEITAALRIVTIGIGAGPVCDAQWLVMHDLLGLNERSPSFVKRYADLATVVRGAFSQYVNEVKKGEFPE